MHWLKRISNQSSFSVGDIVEEKNTKRLGLIVNEYQDRYIIEFDRVADNPFKRETKTLRKEEVLEKFTKVRSLYRKTNLSVNAAEKDVEVSQEDIEKIKDDYVNIYLGGVSAEELENMLEKIYEKIAEMALHAYNRVMEEGTAVFGESFAKRLMLGPLSEIIPPDITGEERKKRIEKLVEQEVALGKKLESELRALFPFSKKVQDKITDIMYYHYTSIDPETGELIEKRYAAPALGQLAMYFLNMYLASKGAPLFVPKEKGYEYGSTFGFNRIRDLVMKQLEEREIIERLEKIKEEAPELRKRVYDWLFKEGKISADELKMISEYFPEITSSLPAVSSSKKKEFYDIMIGDEVIDEQYGKGKVTSIANLNDGFVEVSFGPNIKISSYPASKITKPFYAQVQTNEFQCPVDFSYITAEACLGSIPGTSCTFLKFIDNKPVCTYHEEMKKYAKKTEEERNKEIIREVKKVALYEKTKKDLEKALKLAQFEDHDYFIISSYVPIQLFGYVKKKGSEKVGEVISRNPDNSLEVRWTSGEKTTNWEVELEGISRKAWTTHIIQKLFERADEVEDIAKKRKEGELTGESFMNELKRLRDSLGLTGISEHTFLTHFWETVRRLGLSELAPPSPSVPIYEISPVYEPIEAE